LFRRTSRNVRPLPAERARLSLIRCPDRGRLPLDPPGQAALVSETVEKLEQVLELVNDLDQLPTGNRQGLVDQLTGATDSLRELCFLDAIY
jgi:hypothetical protein